jgi:DNA-binding response OmpR family regulator
MSARKVVVIVDDSIDLIRLYQEYLKDEGFEVHVAGGAEEGLLLFQSLGAVDLLLVDCLMPKMNGAGFLKELFKRRPDLRGKTRVYGMSGLLHESHELTEMRPLVDRIVDKASDLNEMLHMVQNGVS